MSTMTYLTSSMHQEHGGSTIVWPGSHHKIGSLAASDPVRYEMFHTLAGALEESGALELQPIELKVRAGDVLFHDMFLAHYGSENHAQGKPRLAFNMKWGRHITDQSKKRQRGSRDRFNLTHGTIHAFFKAQSTTRESVRTGENEF